MSEPQRPVFAQPAFSDRFLGIFGLRSFVKTYASSSSVALPLKGDAEGESKSLVQLTNDVPELRNGTYSMMSPALFNGDLQTMYANTPREHIWKVHYGRRCIYWDDGSLVTADYRIETPTDKAKWAEQVKYTPLGDKTPPLPTRLRYLNDEEVEELRNLSKEDAEQKPLLVLLHGLSGGSHEAYVRAVVDEITKPEFGFDCVVLNSRGCARTPISTPQLFCGVWTEDIRRFVRLLRKEQPENRRIYLIGFSLGASILANYLGQEGELLNTPESRVDAAMVVANPWDLNISSQVLSTSVLGRYLYSPSMAKNLLRLIKNHQHALASHPEFDYEARKHVKSMEDFDNVYTGPLFGFDSAKDYYRSGSSVQRVLGIRIPTLLVNAIDDPIVTKDCIPYVEACKNPYLVLATTSLGGHLGWTQPGPDNNWLAKVSAKFFKTFDTQVDHVKGIPEVEVVRPKRLWKGDRFDV